MSNLGNIFPMFLLIVGWTIVPFLKKIPLEKITPFSFLVFNHLTVTVIILAILSYLLITNKFTETIEKNFTKLGKKEIRFIILVSIIGLITGISWIFLIKNNFVDYVVPHIQPLIITLTLIISYFIANEPINRYHVFGIFLVVSGLYAINYGKNIPSKTVST